MWGKKKKRPKSWPSSQKRAPRPSTGWPTDCDGMERKATRSTITKEGEIRWAQCSIQTQAKLAPTQGGDSWLGHIMEQQSTSKKGTHETPERKKCKSLRHLPMGTRINKWGWSPGRKKPSRLRSRGPRQSQSKKKKKKKLHRQMNSEVKVSTCGGSGAGGKKSGK